MSACGPVTGNSLAKCKRQEISRIGSRLYVWVLYSYAVRVKYCTARSCRLACTQTYSGIDNDEIGIISLAGYRMLVQLLWILNRYDQQGDHKRFSSQRMIEIKHRRVWKYFCDPGSPACIIVHNVAFLCVEGQIGCGDSLSLGFIVRTKGFFRRQWKRFGLSRLHPGHLLLERSWDNMLSLYELLNVAIDRSRVVAKRDVVLHCHFRSVPHCLGIGLYEALELKYPLHQ